MRRLLSSVRHSILAGGAATLLAACVTTSGPSPQVEAPPAAPPATAPAAMAKPITTLSMHTTAGGIDLALRHRLPVALAPDQRDRVVLLLPPADMPTTAVYDVKGYSLMADLAGRGFDVWAVDYRGFGHSGPAAAGSPRLDQAVADAREAIDAVLAATKAHELVLMGQGYGGLVAAATAERSPAQVSRLVLVGTAFSFKLGKEGTALRKRALESKPGTLNPRLQAFEDIDWSSGPLKEWQAMAGGKPLAEPAAIEAVAAAFSDTRHLAEGDAPRKVRRPLGPALDLYAVWSGRPPFDPGRIKAPTLILRGERDFLAEPDLGNRLKATKIVREVVVKNATHWLLYEPGREQAIDETVRFLGGH